MSNQAALMLMLGQLLVVVLAGIAFAVYSFPEERTISRFELSAEQINRLH